MKRRTNSGCVTDEPLFDATDFTPGGGDTGTVLISPLIKPGTVSTTFYNHYSTLRTLEDLLLTGQSCSDTKPRRRLGLRRARRQGHIGYAAQAGLGDFGPDVFTAQTYTPAAVPSGYQAVPASGSSTVYCPKNVNLGQGRQEQQSREWCCFGGTGGGAGAPGCGTTGGRGGNGGNGQTGARSRRQRRQRRQRRLPTRGVRERGMAHFGRCRHHATRHPALQRHRRQRRQGRHGWERQGHDTWRRTVAMAATGSPGVPGAERGERDEGMTVARHDQADTGMKGGHGSWDRAARARSAACFSLVTRSW